MLGQQRWKFYTVLLQIHSCNCLQKIDVLDLRLIKSLQNEQGCIFCLTVYTVLKLVHYRHSVQCESKNPPYGFLNFFSQTVGNFWSIFTHLLYDHFYTRLQIFIHISPTLTKLCHTKRDRPPSEFLHFTRTLTSKFAYWANKVIVGVMSYPTCLLTL